MRFKSRVDYRKHLELQAAPEVDEDGKEINPHIPSYMSTTPWYHNTKTPTLNHQKNWKSKADYSKDQCVKGEKSRSFRADRRTIDQQDYDGKYDRWNGYESTSYAREIMKRFEAEMDARETYLKEQQLKNLENGNQFTEGSVTDEDTNEDLLEVDEAKMDESKQLDFAKIEKRVRSSGGGSTGPVRNLRIREDTAKYLLNLDGSSAHYDPKSRSMREDPLPDDNPNEKFYGGDNQYRTTGQPLEFKEIHTHVWEASEKGIDVHLQAAPSQAEMLFKNSNYIKKKLKFKTKNAILEKYGNAASEDAPAKELLLFQ
ncbi:hypothetical protein IFM89_035388 [Coptis chinensis]|uniref:Pre-mRNA-splicing factor SLU7 n=1 Tax=Coptis chinensis TaxID=261450 RepID=A0A835LPR7_9MAGN|nr:hypothetical protein IFM89_035388 [Coptis chinensis]